MQMAPQGSLATVGRVQHLLFQFAFFKLYMLLLLLRLLYNMYTADALSDEGMVLLELKREIEQHSRDPGALSLNSRGGPGGYDIYVDDRLQASIRPTGFLEDWNEKDSTPCAWLGVRCSGTPHSNSSAVQSLRFSGWSLTYFNFSRLSSLRSLEELDLSDNFILADWSWINEALNLYDRGSRLTWLDLSGNRITMYWGNPITDYGGLRYLSLARNDLHGPIPRLDGLAHLQHLSLAGNRLSESIPPQHFVSFPNLMILDLSCNELSGDIPDLLGLTNLLRLNLSHNHFTGFGNNVGDGFRSLKSLKLLDISRNLLQGSIPPAIASLSNIQILDLSANQLSGDIPDGIRPNSTLLLDLSNNNLSGNIPHALLDADANRSLRLKSVNLSHNRLVGVVPQPLSWYNDTSPLFLVDLSYNNALNGTFPTALKGRILCLQQTQLGGHVNDLFPIGNAAHGPGQAWTWNAPAFLALQAIRVEGSAFLGELNVSQMLLFNENYGEQLQVLDLSNTEIVIRSTVECPDPLQAMLQRFRFLLELRLTGIDLTGATLPKWLNRSPRSESWLLQVLDLSNSGVGGFLPDDLFNGTYFPALKQLNLSSNRLEGPVPASIARLARRIVVDLSNNPGLCGDPLPPCGSGSQVKLFLSVIIPSVCISVTSLLLLAWRWRVYSQRHKQDADLIATLLQSKDNPVLMSLRDLKKATGNFAESSEIGVGGFGKVYLGQLSQGTMVAVKRSRREGSEQDKQQFLNEVRILSQVHHRNLVTLLGCCMEKRVALLVFEYVPNGNLLEHLQGTQGEAPLDWTQRLLVAVQTADALAYLHSAANPPIFHRDVKSANILLDKNLNAKVADFGISKLAPMGATHVSTAAMGTPGYIDPEYHASGQLTAKSDVYSFGVLLLELISAQPVVDLERGKENPALVGLVRYALPLLNARQLDQLVDPALLSLGILSSAAGKESILAVGRLAVKCLAPMSMDRPSMQQVWKQLQTLWGLYSYSTSPAGCPQPDIPSGHNSAYACTYHRNYSAAAFRQAPRSSPR